jgi:hypothetical protein
MSVLSGHEGSVWTMSRLAWGAISLTEVTDKWLFGNRASIVLLSAELVTHRLNSALLSAMRSALLSSAALFYIQGFVSHFMLLIFLLCGCVDSCLCFWL